MDCQKLNPRKKLCKLINLCYNKHMNSKFRISLAIATFLMVLSGSLIAINNVNNLQPLQYAKAQATDPSAPTTPGVRLPTATTSTTTGQTTTSNTGTTSTGTTTGTTTGGTTGATTTSSTTGQTGGINVTPPPTPNISSAGLLDGVIPATTTTSTTATATGSATATSATNQAAVNTTNTVRTGGLATTGILVLAAAGVGVYYYQKNHKQSKFALKMSEKKIGGKK
jgi:hypothetical protein